MDLKKEIPDNHALMKEWTRRVIKEMDLRGIKDPTSEQASLIKAITTVAMNEELGIIIQLDTCFLFAIYLLGHWDATHKEIITNATL